MRTPATAALAFSLLTPLTAQDLDVLTVSPANQALTASAASPIEVTFDLPVDASTLTTANVHVWGRWSGMVPGQLSLSPSGASMRWVPDRPYFAAEEVTFSMTHRVKATSGQPLTGGFFSTFWVRPAPASGTFTLRETIPLRSEGEGLIRTYGVFSGDLNRDGSPDISASNEDSGDIRMLLNDGCGNFGAITTHALIGQNPSPQHGADFNGDGWTDIVSGNAAASAISVLLNDGTGGFGPPTIYPSGGYTHGLGVIDVDSDGDPDVAVPNHNKVVLFINDGTGALTAGTSYEAGDREDNVAVGDANGDGIADLMVGSLGGTVALLLGDGAGGFTLSSTITSGGSAFHIAGGDINGDGAMDVALANWGTNTLGIVRSDGNGNLVSATTYFAGSTPAAVDLGDIDGDGDLDATVANFASGNYYVYWNDGAGNFSAPDILPSSIAGSCCTLVDLDRDGDTDIIAADELADELRLYTQDAVVPPGTQPPSCTATLRLNQWAHRGGFGTVPMQPIPIGENLHFGVTGTPSVPFLLAVGFPASPGVPLAFGTWNFAPTFAPLPFVNGFVGGAPGLTNADGEGQFVLPIAPTLPAGGIAAFQGVVLDPTSGAGLTLTNPQTVILTP